MRVAVVIINYNHGRYLAEAIQSVELQTRRPDQIVVVDDGSTDDSREVLARFPGVTTVLQANGGPSAATNAGVAAATGEIIMFLDADDLMLPERVERVLDAFASVEDAAWVWHPVQHIDRDSRAILGAENHVGFTPGRHDLRAEVRRGRLPMTTPATSGLAWRAPFLRELMPIPLRARGQDLYLKFASMALAPGYVLAAVLAQQGIHERNAYTSRPRAERRIFQVQNAVEMLPGFTVLGRDLDGLAHRFAAESIVQSRLGMDLTGAQRRLLASFTRSLRPRRLLLFAVAVVVAIARSTVKRGAELLDRRGS